MPAEGSAGQSATINNDVIDTADFGFWPSGSVGDLAYIDTDSNGVFTGVDTVLVGVNVDMYPGSCPPDLTTLTGATFSAVTDATGNYLFENVLDGPYCVVATDPSGRVQLQGAAGQPVSVNSSSVLTADFGFMPAGSIGDQVYLDNNLSGDFDGTDSVLPNITIDLYDGACPADITLLGTRYRTTVSNSNGEYLFDALPDGDYCVVSESGLTNAQLQGAGGHSVTVNNDETLTADFGYGPTVSIGDTVYIDANLNGTQDNEERGIAGSNVTLYAGACTTPLDANLIMDVVQTEYNGYYEFNALNAGSYCVTASNPGDGDGIEGAGGRTVTLLNAHDYTVDFGFAPAGSIGDLIYIDNNMNTRYDAVDEHVENVVVELYSGSCPADLSTLILPIASTVSDADGLYLFDFLDDGDYCVVAMPSGLGEPLQGGDWSKCNVGWRRCSYG